MIDYEVTQTKPLNLRGSHLPATPGAPVEEPKVVIPTPEEIAERARDTFSVMGWTMPDSMKPAAEPAKPAAAASATPAVAAPPAVPADELISRTAAAVGAEMAKHMAPKPAAPAQPEAPTAATLDMGPSDRQDYEAIVFLEKSDRRFAGLSNKFLAYLKDLYTYEEDWIAKNPEKEFNPDDAEHDAWYEAHPAPIDRQTIEKAKIDRAVEERYKNRVEPELKAMKAERAWNQARPDVFLTGNRKVLAIIKIACPEIAAVLSDGRGEPVMTEANAAKAEAVNPIANDILNRYAAQAWAMVVELEKTVLRDVELKLNPRDKVHAAIIQMQEAEEARILADPAERSKGGKQFITIVDYYRVPESQRENYRILTVDDVEDLIVRNYAAQAKKEIEYQVQLGKKMFGGNQNADNPPANGGPDRPARLIPGPVPSGMRHRPPSISSASDVVSTPEPNTPARKTYGQQAVETYFK